MATDQRLQSSTTLEGLDPNGARVLIVDDNVLNLLITTAPLEAKGYDVTTAADGAEALMTVLKTPYHAVLMDCQMPVMDGLEATRRIRYAESQAKLPLPDGVARNSRLPIIALTASCIPGETDRCFAAGMDAFLSKPFEANTLLETIACWVGMRVSQVGINRKDPSKTSADCAPPVDYDGFIRVCMNDVDFAMKMLGEFERIAGDTLKQLGEAAALNDTIRLGHLAHRLKGSAGYLRASALREAASRLEDAITYGQASITNTLCDSLQKEITLCVGYFPAIRERARNPLRSRG